MRIQIALFIAVLFGFNAACSSIKTRSDVAADQREEKIESGELPADPIDDEALDDGLAEMGIDPNGSAESNATPEPEVAADEEPAVEEKPVVKKKKKVAKKKKKLAKNTKSSKKRKKKKK